MKKSTLALLTTVIAFAPLTAFAQDTQLSVQDQLDFGSYGIPSSPDAQTSVQTNANEAAAIGHNNVIFQNADQTNIQDQVDVNQYLPSGYGY